MSRENVKVVRRVFEITQESLRRGDLGAGWDKAVLEGVIAPNVVWRAGRERTWAPANEDFVGRAGWVELMCRWTEDFDDLGLEAEEIVDADNDRVVGITRWYGTGKGSRVPVETRIGAVHTLKGGRVVRVDPLREAKPALRAVGLRE